MESIKIDEKVLSVRDQREIAKGNSGCLLQCTVWIVATIIALASGGSEKAGFICWGIALVISIALSFTNRKRQKEKKEEIEGKRAERKEYIDNYIKEKLANGFVLSREIRDIGEEYSIAIDQSNKKWMLILANAATAYTYNFQDLINFEVCQDGKTIISGNEGEALLGGLMFGTVGAIAGAAGAKEAVQNCTDLHIDISVNDVRHPYQCISFISATVAKESPEYTYETAVVKEVAALLSYIKANSNELETQKISSRQSNYLNNNDKYIALEKLFELKEKGIVTEEEYKQKKQEILNL